MNRWAALAQARKPDHEWVADLVATLPHRWQTAIQTEWRGAWAWAEEKRRAANLAALLAVRQLNDAQRAGLRADADDETIRARAQVFARHYAAGLRKREGAAAVAWCLEEMDRHGMRDFWPGWVPGKPGKEDKRRTPESCLLRVQCLAFWRRVLRRIHAQTIEKCSIGLGLVNKDRDCYVSDLSAKRRRQQIAGNAAALEATELENEFGQRMKLSDLAAKSTANKTVRRAELMTRISGFDVIAQDMGHEGLFVTVTCPSRMHKWTERGGRVVPNAKHDGTTPGQAQKYLAEQWAKARAWLGRRAVGLYGFRVAEPHHDGCPHWHLLLFFDEGNRGLVQYAFNRYFLANDSATERGAAQRRVTFKRIDRSKGSAAAYIAKYIAKNVDGYAVGVDMYGAPAMESAQRVDAWASTWRIRQFQQIGGPPVTVWRELRRLNPENLDSDLMPESLGAAVRGVNVGQIGGRLAHGWQAYTMAQGGPCASRKHHAIKLLKQETGEVNKYREVKPADVIGVQAWGVNHYKPAHMAAMFAHKPWAVPTLTRPAVAQIESERAQWRQVVRGAPVSVPVLEPGGAAARPWTRVNNCTHTTEAVGDAVRAAVRVRRSKTGRFPVRVKRAGAGGPSNEVNHGIEVSAA